MVKLQVLICTIGAEGIRRVVESSHPEVEGVEYLVSWQLPDGDMDVPEALVVRDDVKVCKVNSRGICRNRNNAVRCATAPLCLMSDDDVCYKEEELKLLIYAFEQYPDADIITVRHHSDNYPKAYPDLSLDLVNAPKGYYVTCFEIAFRISAVKGVVKFNENISIGTPVLRCGEEDVFIHDAKKAGLKARFVPIVVGTHNHPTTAGRDAEEPYFWMTKGAVFSYIHRFTWLPRIVVNAWRASRKSEKSFGFFLINALRGVKYAHENKVFKSTEKVGLSC